MNNPRKKPVCTVTVANLNAFALITLVAKTLRECDCLGNESAFLSQAYESRSFDEVLSVARRFVVLREIRKQGVKLGGWP